jgi:hypothetical protein
VVCQAIATADNNYVACAAFAAESMALRDRRDEGDEKEAAINELKKKGYLD